MWSTTSAPNPPAPSSGNSLRLWAKIFFALGFLSLQNTLSAFASDSILIPEGQFVSGSDPQNNVNVPAFSIDRHEVTNEDFAQVFPNHAYREGAAKHPVTHVTWQEAKAYCERLGQRLPSEVEWEKAARGTEGFQYPWGDTLPKRKPHPYFSGVVKKKVGSNRQDVSPYGVHDMAGSVWEWVSTEDGDQRAARGGLWNLHLDFEYSQTHDRISLPADQRFIFLGFRCARSEP